MEYLANHLDAFLETFSGWFPAETFFAYSFNIRALLAVVLIGILCGSVGALVVGNRMAFFSDALAHCAFAGVALGLLLFFLTGRADEEFRFWITTNLLLFGILFGVLITFVRERTGLANDTVIGVFFAGAMGMGAIFTRMVAGKRYFNLESFIFGDPLFVQSWEIVMLLGLCLVFGYFLVSRYNQLVLASIHPSLARSRRVQVRALQYAFVILLALLVNLCVQVVGILLINAMLIVPAAAAANVSRNLRQLFWWSIGLSTFGGLAGPWLGWELNMRWNLQVGVSGTIVVLGTLIFAASVPLSRWIKQGG
ncbi:MAG: metal ABC transporter permease [Gemmataceae bacterium]|nr:metal ABC transporter permease [Gemmataceae bacterium]